MPIDGARLLNRLSMLREIGTTASGGVTRLAYSPDDVRARALLAEWMVAAGMEVRVDPACNLIGTLPGSTPGAPVLMSGSHADTVVEGGHLDGAYGAVAAIEVAASLRDAGTTLRHPYVAVAFANEEGARGTPGLAGSKAMAGVALPLDAVNDDGKTLADLLRNAGGAPQQLADAAWAPGSIAAHVELHIEQGPVLEARATQIGIVEAITGRRDLDVVVSGQPNHAGTTPMDLRHDAVAAAAQVVLAVEQLATGGTIRVATVGHLVPGPNVRNVVAGSALLGVDLRDVDESRLDRAVEDLRAACDDIAAARSVGIEVRERSRQPSMPCAPAIADTAESCARDLGLTTMRMPSGAGHDSQVLGTICPVGMIFVPSAGGISHSPREHTDPEPLTVGASVLLDTIVALDARLPLDVG